MLRRFAVFAVTFFGAAVALADMPVAVPNCCGQVTAKADAPKAEKKYPRGHKPPSAEELQRRHAAAFKRHDHRVKNLPRVAASSFDCRTMGWVLPVNDQGQCGDCFGISTIDACAMAFVKAGLLKNEEASRWSGQYGLDCGGFQGGCNGGDESQVFEFAKSNGFPLTINYGPYTASPGRCKQVDPSKLLKIAGLGYCTPSQEQGIASTDDIKRCMVAYGPISVAFDASECDAYQWPQTMTGRGANVDHAVLCIGWDDNHDNGDGTKGAFIGYNQWGEQWGDKGAFWIKYGADSWGTEAIWVTASTLPPPPPPPPPPSPPGPPTPSGPFTGTITTIETYQNGTLTGKSVIIGNPTSVSDDLKTAGVSPAVVLDVLTLLGDIKARAPITTIAADLMKILADLSH